MTTMYQKELANPPLGALEEQMAKHTKGPWQADDNGDGTHCITAGSGCDVADTRSSVDEEANARLLAAAPDLLATLENIVKRAVLVPCKDGGKDAELGESGSIAAGKWRVESAVDGWIVQARSLITSFQEI